MRLIFALLVSAFATLLSFAAYGETMKLAVTTSFENSGLSDVLLPLLKKETGVEVQLIVVGTGQAFKLGKSGDVDAILVHSKQAELAFLKAGFASHRREIMYNDFVLVGPKDDPANIADARSARDALVRIATAKAPFISRGDDSGTHHKERILWSEARVLDFEPAWYREVGSGMGATLNTASGLNSYVLSDRASWLNFKNKGQLALLYSGDPDLYNQYSYLPINRALHSHVKADTSAIIENWLVSKQGQEAIAGFKLDGKALFTPNAQPKNN